MAYTTRGVQERLIRLHRDPGPIDGQWGPRTQNALLAWLEAYGSVVKGFEGWPRKRLVVAFEQSLLDMGGMPVGKIDGYEGPQTDYARELYKAMLRGETLDLPVNRDDDGFLPAEDNSPKRDWPRQRDVGSYFGRVGENQGKVNVPFKMKIAWDKSQTLTRFSAHEKVVDSAERAFKKIASAYSEDDIEKHGFNLFGGCLNVRRMRGGSRYSMHAWGIAIDFDPIRNQLRWTKGKAYLAKPACEEFWAIWESEGWASLGRRRDFDWMHVQAARL